MRAVRRASFAAPRPILPLLSLPRALRQACCSVRASTARAASSSSPSKASRALGKRGRKTAGNMSLRVAVVGCVHGELDAVYGAVAESCGERPADLVLCTGDFEALRNEDDLECMAVPDKYKAMGSFHKYYRGAARAPPTIFVGGNHEASNHLAELPLGGLVAPCMYYLGHAGVVSFRGLRIGGLSGIFKSHDYPRPRREAPPYDGSSMRSIYHTRRADAAALARVARPLDVVLSHDWPLGVTRHGDEAALLRDKPFLKGDLRAGGFGSRASAGLIAALRPRYWFASHMHVKFAALWPHERAPPTRFLALDKALPRRDFVQILDVLPAPGAPPFKPLPADGVYFEHDPEWLAILRAGGAEPGVDPAVEGAPGATPLPDEALQAAVDAVRRAGVPLAVKSPDHFIATAQVYNPAAKRKGRRPTCVRVQESNVALGRALGLDMVEVLGVAPVPLGVSMQLEERTDSAGEGMQDVEKRAAGEGVEGVEKRAVGEGMEGVEKRAAEEGVGGTKEADAKRQRVEVEGVEAMKQA